MQSPQAKLSQTLFSKQRKQEAVFSNPFKGDHDNWPNAKASKNLKPTDPTLTPQSGIQNPSPTVYHRVANWFGIY